MGKMLIRLKMGLGNVGTLTFIDSDGKIYNYRATSGRIGITDQTQEDKGPIPKGSYTILPHEISKGSFKRSLIGDWGAYRVRLHEDMGTQTYGRKNFFLHGGSKDGSAGCIDIGNKDTELFQLLSKSKDPIKVVVEYPMPMPRLIDSPIYHPKQIDRRIDPTRIKQGLFLRA